MSNEQPDASLSNMDDVLADELAEFESAGLMRRLRRIDEIESTRVTVDGRKLISFGSNDYLGLAGHPALRKAASDILDWGTGATGSRLTTGNFALHEQLEESIARFKHTDDSILFSSGYAANVGVIPALTNRHDLILSDSLNHASLIDGCRLSRAETRVYRHSDIDHACSLLTDRTSYRRLLVATDTVFSMDGDLALLPELVELCRDFDGWLLTDDAHGTGVFGATGSGVVEHFELIGAVHVQMGTLSKAVGTTGAFVAGSHQLIQLLRNKARSFMFSTALPPADVAAASRSLAIIQSEPDRRERLHRNIHQMRDGLKGLGMNVPLGISPIIPLVIGEADKAMKMSAALEGTGTWIPAIRPPTVPADSSRLRITISAAHTDEEISKALTIIWNSYLSL